MILYACGLSSHPAHMAQLEFPSVPIEIKGYRRRKLLNPNETARNIRARSWMANIESAKPIEINTIAARVRTNMRQVRFYRAYLIVQVTWKSILRYSVSHVRFLQDLNSPSEDLFRSEWIMLASCWKRHRSVIIVW